MSDFDTKLIELLEIICEYIPANKPDERAVQLFNELKEMNKQEIEQEEQTSIDELDLSVRSKNLLLRGGVKTIGDLENATMDYLKQKQQRIAELKQQLEEKDKEIERLKVFEKAYYFNQTQVSQESMDLLLQNAYQVHNETQLTIQELEKVKEEFGLKSGWSSETDMCFDLEQFIKQQIKELKGE